MPKWEISQKPELIPVSLALHRYDPVLAEIAELLYDYWASSASSVPDLKPTQNRNSLALNTLPKSAEHERKSA